MQFDDPDLDDEFSAFQVIKNVSFPGHVGRRPETRPDHKDYKGVKIEQGMEAKGITIVRTPNSMIGSKRKIQALQGAVCLQKTEGDQWGTSNYD